jgi:hypothetical protein
MSLIGTSGPLKCIKQRARGNRQPYNGVCNTDCLLYFMFQIREYVGGLRTQHNHRSAVHSDKQSCLAQYFGLLICIVNWQCEGAVECTGTSRGEAVRLYCRCTINNIDWKPFALLKGNWVWFADSRCFGIEVACTSNRCVSVRKLWPYEVQWNAVLLAVQ